MAQGKLWLRGNPKLGHIVNSTAQLLPRVDQRPAKRQGGNGKGCMHGTLLHDCI